MSEALPPFSISLRVYYEDTDAAGIVYYANYLKFAERARTELLRATGLDHHILLAQHDMILAVRRCEVDFRRPARLDDRLEVSCVLLDAVGARLRMRQEIKRDQELLVTVLVELAVLNSGLRPRRLPDALAEALREAATSA